MGIAVIPMTITRGKENRKVKGVLGITRKISVNYSAPCDWPCFREDRSGGKLQDGHQGPEAG